MMDTPAFNPLAYPSCLALPDRIAPGSAWIEHIPFGMTAVEITKPGMLVELGTHSGTSYCAYCQTVQRLSLPTKCYAIDNWLGDAHAGFYGEEVYQELKAYHDARFSSFSSLLRSEFSEAVHHFADRSIDFLHIDGYHTYDAVKQDFETWLPKLSDRAVVLFHDTNERKEDFGIWKFWDEVKAIYPSFEFLHGHGLGMLATGSQYPSGLKAFFFSEQPAMLRDFYSRLGKVIQDNLAYAQNLQHSEALAELLNDARSKLVSAELKANQLEASELKSVDLTRQINALTSEYGHVLERIDSLERESSEKDVSLQRLGEEVQSYALKIDGLSVERDRLIRLKEDAETKCLEIDQLRYQNERQSALIREQEDEIIRYVTSKSWRYTRPIRKIIKRLKRWSGRA